MELISARVWNGHVTINISFYSHIYLLRARRNAYFPLYFSQLAAFFDMLANVDLQHKQLWLQHKQTPLHWNLPIGVLHDIFCDPESPSWHLSLHAETAESPYPLQILPVWGQNLTEPRQSLPESCQNVPESTQNSHRSLSLDTLQHVYMNSLKQANYVLSGNSRAVMRLSNEDTQVLWKSVVSNDYSQLQAIYKKICTEITSVPLKIYLDKTTVVQAPCKAKQTLRQCLAPYINLQQHDVWIQGIRASQMYELPVSEIWTRFHYLDMVMYVVAGSMQAC